MKFVNGDCVFNEESFESYVLKIFSDGEFTVQEAEEVLDRLKNKLKDYAFIRKKH